jgi:hypothetical protein
MSLRQVTVSTTTMERQRPRPASLTCSTGGAPSHTSPWSQSARRLAHYSGLVLGLALLTLLLVPAFASAALEHAPRGVFGSAAQPTVGESGGAIAVDQSTGDVLAVDTEAGTLGRYHEASEFHLGGRVLA